MNHAVDTGQNFHKCAKIGDAHHFAGVNASEDGDFNEGFNAAANLRLILGIGGGNIDRAIIVDIDLGTGFFL